MVEYIKITGQTLVFLVLLDILILFFALLQFGVEGRTGYWDPFWSTQAEFVLNLWQ